MPGDLAGWGIIGAIAFLLFVALRRSRRNKGDGDSSGGSDERGGWFDGDSDGGGDGGGD